MKTWSTSTEVDYVIIGSGAAGGIMAKQLSVAGFSVVVLEQGGWGKYGREHEYSKDEWLARNENDEDRLMSDPKLQVNTFRPNDKVKAAPGSHSYGRVVPGGGTVTYGGSMWRHLPYIRVSGSVLRSDHSLGYRDGGLADHLRGAGTLLHAGRVGDGDLRTACQFAVFSADVEGLSAAARAAQEFVFHFPYRCGQTGIDCHSGSSRHHYEALYGARRLRQLRNLLGLRMPGEERDPVPRLRCSR